MKMTDMRAKARAIFGPANPEPMPNQPNGAKALQERANARPIPTYKVGGSVKKPTPPQPTAAEREAERKRRESLAKAKVTQSEADTLGRAMRSEGPGYKMGGKAAPASPQKKPKTPLSSDELERRYDKQREKDLLVMPQKPTGYSSSMKSGGKVQTSADTAKKLATEMGGMKKGGKPKKDGLAVMIAIGSPKKPVKKMHGGRVHADGDKPVKKMGGGMMYAEGGSVLPTPTPQPKSPPPPMPQPKGDFRRATPPTRAPDRKEPNPGATKRAKGGPAKFAQGGAGKVRKGMMTPEGTIIDAMNKVRGK
jgi:hypothetical protein